MAKSLGVVGGGLFTSILLCMAIMLITLRYNQWVELVDPVVLALFVCSVIAQLVAFSAALLVMREREKSVPRSDEKP